jgi:glycosyltransferase involved in cell wall biosynthesis
LFYGIERTRHQRITLTQRSARCPRIILFTKISFGTLPRFRVQADIPRYEVIVQDGCSTDNTARIIEKCGPYIKYASERDTGVYDAWNKALDRANGDWAIFLGADDYLLADNVLARCHLHIKKLSPAVIFAYGNVLHGKDGKVGSVWDRTLSQMYHYFLTSMGLPFPATFTRLAALKKARFDAGYKIAGDYDLAARLITAENACHLPVNVTWMEKGGLSNDPAYRCLLLEERARVLFTRILPKAEMLVEASAEHLWD